MCGRYATTADPATLAAELDALDETPNAEGGGSPRVGYNIAPTTTVAAVVDRRDDSADADSPLRRRIRAMRWGLVPHWSKEIKKGPLLFNARAESAADKPAFRTSMKSKRCLIPMDGWYEWVQADDPVTGKLVKVPYFMTPRDGSRIYVAGVWSAWRDPSAQEDAPPLLSCAVLTTDAVGVLTEIHDRMPLVVSPDRWQAWLAPDRPAAEDLLQPPADFDSTIEVRRVSTKVNQVRNEGSDLIVPVGDADEREPQLF
ncbi:SOS response-associated peptidase [Hoyosella subflava]|nr:SOS response-associated peptidase [Hoyosella subflava]